jgi:Ca2+-binding RTX toxin-like protein
MVVFVGSDDNDIFTGSSGDDVANGNGGNDQLNGADGNDTLDGGAGTDTLSGGAGDDILVQTGALTGAETFDGGAGTDTIRFNPSPIASPVGPLTSIPLNSAILSSIERFEFGSAANTKMQITLPFAQIGSGLASNAELVGGAGQDSLILFTSGGGDFTMPSFVRTNWNLDLSASTWISGTTDFVALVAGDDANYTLRASSTHAGGESLSGRGGNDILIGGDGTESLSGGFGGADQLFGGGGTDFFGVQANPQAPTDYHDDLFDGGDGIDYLSVIGGQYSPMLYFAGDVVSIEGINLAPALIFNGTTFLPTPHLVMSSTTALQFGPDVRVRGQGEITIEIQPGDTIDASHAIVEDGADIVLTLDGSDVSDTIVGSVGNDNIYAHGGNDIINGFAGDDFIYGDDGNDIINGFTGDDYIFGGDGNDTVNGADGDDTLEGGEDIDLLSYAGAAGGVTVSLAIAYEQNTGGAGCDRVIDFENLTGSSFADTLTGDAGANLLTGHSGDDTLDGGAGGDTAVFIGNRADYSVVDLGGGSYRITDTRGGARDGVDTISNIEFARFANGTYALSTMFGGATITGTGGNDTISATQTVAGQLLPSPGGDTLYGFGGNDKLDGGAGADAMYGGQDNDIYTVENSGDQAIEAAGEGTDIVNTSVSYTIGDNIENLTLTGSGAINGTGNVLANKLIGNAAANTLTGLDGNDTLDGQSGADTMVGGLGNDSYTVDDAGDQVIEAIGEGTDKVSVSVSYTLGANVEDLTLTGLTAINGTGNALANTLTGNAAANTLTGLDGNDALNGKAGADTMVGGLGNDSYTVDDAGDQAIEATGEGTDKVSASVSFTLGANVEDLTLTGSTAINGAGNALANKLTGNAAANVLTGLDGNDTLDGKAGADTMVGGLGNDSYTVDDAGDQAIEATGEGTDKVSASISFTLGANFEDLTLTGSNAIDGTGNTLGNMLIGNGGANILNGGAGNDTILGGGGADVLSGGSGADKFVFGARADSSGSALDTIIDFSRAELDRIDFAKIDANMIASGNQAFSFIGAGAFTGSAGQLRYVQSGGVTDVFGDVDGDTIADFQIHLTGNINFVAGDFVL